MIIVVCAVIAVIFGLWYWVSEGHYFEDLIWVLLCGVAGLLIGFVILLCAQPLFFDAQYDEQLVETVDLIALEDNFGVQGSAYLCSTQIDSELKYTYLYKSTRGLTTGTIDADDAYLRYDAQFPHIEIYEEHHSNAILDWLFCSGGTFYVIYVPEGSIVTNSYNVDLK